MILTTFVPGIESFHISDSKYGHKGERNVCYVVIVSYAMCHINLVKFLTNPMTTYVVQIKILTTSWD